MHLSFVGGTFMTSCLSACNVDMNAFNAGYRLNTYVSECGLEKSVPLEYLIDSREPIWLLFT